MVKDGLPPFHAPDAPIPVNRTLPECGPAQEGARNSMPFNNGSEREIRPSVIFRKVTNGFRSTWGPGIHAGYRSVTGTARLQGQSAWTAIRALVDGSFAVAEAPALPAN